MRECDKHITECGVTDAIKVVTKPASTIRVQETVTTVITKVERKAEQGIISMLT